MSTVSKILSNLLVIIVSVLVSLLIAEGFIRIFAPQSLTGTSRVQDATGLLLNKDSGHSQHQFGDISVVYRFGKYHTRQLLHPVSDAAGKERVLVVGDSFTFGWLTADGMTYVDKLQARYPNYQFINGAAAGWGTADYVKYIENYCTQIKPQIVLTFINTDDIGRAYKSALYSFDNGILKSQTIQRDPIKTFINDLPFYNFVSEHSHLLALVKKLFYQSQPNRDISGKQFPHLDIASQANRSAAVAKGQALFLRLKELTASCGAQLVVLYTGWEDYTKPSGDQEPTMNFLRGATAFFRDNGITFYDLSKDPALMDVWKNRPSYIIANDWHPNAKGVDAIFKGTVDALNGTVLK